MTRHMQFSAGLTALALGLTAASCATAGEGPATLEAFSDAQDWQNTPGDALARDFEAAASRLFLKQPRANTIASLNVAGYECIYGEAHADYPEPAAQCTRSFATRACQMDWEVFSTADKGVVDSVSTTFTRDCVGEDRDWPTPKASPIDDQLAPPTLIN
jgi:hypothetical protein